MRAWVVVVGCAIACSSPSKQVPDASLTDEDAAVDAALDAGPGELVLGGPLAYDESVVGPPPGAQSLEFAQIAWNGTSYLAAWRVGPHPYEVRAAYLSATGVRLSAVDIAVLDVPAVTPTSLRVACLPTGECAIGWFDLAASTTGIVRFAADGTRVDTSPLAFSSSDLWLYAYGSGFMAMVDAGAIRIPATGAPLDSSPIAVSGDYGGGGCYSQGCWVPGSTSITHIAASNGAVSTTALPNGMLGAPSRIACHTSTCLLTLVHGSNIKGARFSTAGTFADTSSFDISDFTLTNQSTSIGVDSTGFLVGLNFAERFRRVPLTGTSSTASVMLGLASPSAIACGTTSCFAVATNGVYGIRFDATGALGARRLVTPAQVNWQAFPTVLGDSTGFRLVWHDVREETDDARTAVWALSGAQPTAPSTAYPIDMPSYPNPLSFRPALQLGRTSTGLVELHGTFTALTFRRIDASGATIGGPITLEPQTSIENPRQMACNSDVCAIVYRLYSNQLKLAVIAADNTVTVTTLIADLGAAGSTHTFTVIGLGTEFGVLYGNPNDSTISLHRVSAAGVAEAPQQLVGASDGFAGGTIVARVVGTTLLVAWQGLTGPRHQLFDATTFQATSSVRATGGMPFGIVPLGPRPALLSTVGGGSLRLSLIADNGVETPHTLATNAFFEYGIEVASADADHALVVYSGRSLTESIPRISTLSLSWQH